MTQQWPMEPHRAIAVPVAWRDILPWTKPGCRSCDGRGVIVRLVTAGKPASKTLNRKRQTTLCGCALRRFKDVQATHERDGQLFAVEPFVAVSPETMAEVMKATEIQAAKEAEEKAKEPVA